MISNRQLLDERDKLWSQIGDTSTAIRAMQSLSADLRARVAVIEAELNRRFDDKAGPIAGRDDNKIVITDDDGETA